MIADLIRLVGSVGHDDINAWLSDALAVASVAEATSYANASLDRPAIERLFADRKAWENELISHPSVRLVRSPDWRNIVDADHVNTPIHAKARALHLVTHETMQMLEAAGNKWRDRELLNYIADGAWLAMRLVGIRDGIGETYHA
ncbi:MAG: hypothetical protein COA96_16965 [SAR86 cluster bacterium]|uniref:Uncharacterized protein n=1 Tax=SAR86 cluster bacterium TaxID=2030880 RepID=A0A2A5AGV6_9GAMM|nr:MAG: hypothetical protein COA96_16965 [SAR86 cluster bacterium]